MHSKIRTAQEYFEEVSLDNPLWVFVAQCYRVYSGISGALFICLIPLIGTIFLIELYEISTGTIYAFSEVKALRLIEDFSVMLAVSLFVSVCAIYFIRFLSVVRNFMRTTWRSVTPPFEDTEDGNRTRNHSEEEILKKAQYWISRSFVIGLGFFIGFVVILAGFDFLIDEFGTAGTVDSAVEGNIIPKGWVKYVIETISMLPFIGEVSVFLEVLPGNTNLQKFYINSTAALFAVGVRNLIFIFEKFGVVARRARFLPPNRWSALFLLSMSGQVMLIGVLLILLFDV